MLRWGTLALTVAMAAGCATGRAVHNAQAAARRGDYDAAVAFYRQALGREPSRVDLKIALERTTRQASAEHLKRARELEAQDQLNGAVAEYKLSADLDPGSTLALAKAAELERRIRDSIEASRPRPRIDGLRQQAGQSSPVPRLDPRRPVPALRFPNTSVRDLLKTISDLTGININYDQGLEATLGRAYPLDTQEQPLEDVLGQILQANGLTFKVQNPRTIFVYLDNATKRQQFDDVYMQTFYLSNADPQEVSQIVTQMVGNVQGVRPGIVVNKTANALVVRATAPAMTIIENIIRAQDKPKPEVLIEAEILEVDRSFVRQLGLDLNNWQLGFTFSPELAPPNTSGTFPPATPPPFNLNTVSQGASAADFYLTSPTAVIKLLESNSNTKTLAKSQLRGQAGGQLSLRLGDLVPIPQTVFQSSGAGSIANIPTTSVNYQSVGVNLLFTPKVTYQDEIVLESLTLEKSGLGAFLTVGGQQFPTIVTRTAQSSLRLRDGESNLIAGLLRDDDRKVLKGLPGITNFPVLRSLFGNSDSQVDQTDIVMIITPRIIRTHELTPEDLRPVYVGTGLSFGASSTPPLLSPEAIGLLGPAGDAAASGAPNLAAANPAAGAAAVASTPAPQTAMSANAPPATIGTGATTPGTSTSPRNPAVVPIQAVPSTPAVDPGAGGPARVTITAPTPGQDGALLAGGGPYTMPIAIANAAQVTSVTLTITFNPAVMKTPTVTQGSFMMQGGTVPTFVPNVDSAGGRIDLVFSRPAGQAGASGAGLLAAISFVGGAPGVSDVSVTGVATGPNGQSVPMQFTPTRIAVR